MSHGGGNGEDTTESTIIFEIEEGSTYQQVFGIPPYFAVLHVVLFRIVEA